MNSSCKDVKSPRQDLRCSLYTVQFYICTPELNTLQFYICTPEQYIICTLCNAIRSSFNFNILPCLHLVLSLSCLHLSCHCPVFTSPCHCPVFTLSCHCPVFTWFCLQLVLTSPCPNFTLS